MSIGAWIFVGLAIVLLGGAVMCGYEAWAIGTGHATISNIVAAQFKNSPHTYIIGVFIAGVILGSLVTHFTNWSAA